MCMTYEEYTDQVLSIRKMLTVLEEFPAIQRFTEANQEIIRNVFREEFENIKAQYRKTIEQEEL